MHVKYSPMVRWFVGLLLLFQRLHVPTHAASYTNLAKGLSSYSPHIAKSKVTSTCEITGCPIASANGLYAATKNGTGSVQVFFGDHFLLLRSSFVRGVHSPRWALFSSHVYAIHPGLVDANNPPLFSTNANGNWESSQLLTTYPKMWRAVKALETQAPGNRQTLNNMKVSCSHIVDTPGISDSVPSKYLSNSRAARECRALLGPYLEHGSSKLGVLGTFEFYALAQTLDLLREVCDMSIAAEVRDCTPGTSSCDQDFLEYHYGLGMATSRMEETQEAARHFEAVVENYAVNVKQNTEEELAAVLQYFSANSPPKIFDSLTLGKGRRWANPDRATRQKLFDVLVEYIRVNLFGQGERHYGRALVVLAWLRSEPHWVQHPGQSYVDSLYSEVVPLIRMRLGQVDLALPQLAALYQRNKLLAKGAPDFVAGYVLEWTLLNQNQTSSEISVSVQGPKSPEVTESQEILDVIDEYQRDYKNAISIAAKRNRYSGFRIPDAPGSQRKWSPVRLDHVPSRQEFMAFVQRREPFVISMPHPDSNADTLDRELDYLTDHCPSLLEALGWGSTCSWNPDHLCSIGGEEPVQLVLRSNITQHFGVTGEPKARRETTWCSHVKRVFNRSRTEPTAYFDFGSCSKGEDKHYFPLNRLREEMPTPSFLHPSAAERKTKSHKYDPVFEVDKVSLWLGGGGDIGAGNCGLHFDALDNFHIMLHGRKEWTIYDPGDAHLLHFISPANYVLPDGTIRTHQNLVNLQFEKYGYNTRFSKVGTTAEWHQRALFPWANKTRPARFTLDSGEALYLPWGWAHEVESSGQIFLSVTYWSNGVSD